MPRSYNFRTSSLSHAMAVPSPIVEITAQNFQAEVIDKSRSKPVIVLLWSDQIPPSVETRRVMETLARQYQGKFMLALSDIAKDPTVAHSLRIQSVPSIRVIRDGQVIDQVDGPQREAVLRELADRLTMSGSELLKSSLREVLEREDWKTAIELLKKVLREEPNNPAYKVEWADVMVMRGDLAGARKVLATLPEGTPERERPKTRIELAEEALGMGRLQEAQEAVEDDETDLEARYRVAVLLASERRYRGALEQSMEILRRDRSFREDLGRLTMIRILLLLPKDSPMNQEYRQEMFNIMH